MFKNAYVRGVQSAMIQSGDVTFPDEASAAKVADYIADRMTIDPVNGVVPREITRKVAEHVIDASREFKRLGAQPGNFGKLASVDDLGQLAHRHAVDLMEKAAEGSTIEGGDKGNKEPQSPQGETKMDTAQRPEGYAENSLAKTQVDTKPGEVGKTEVSPAKPAESPAGSNSVTEQSRTASLDELIRKIAATGSTIMGGDKGNKTMSSAEAKMDASQRPTGYATLPHQGDLGELMHQYSAQSAVGKETAHPNKPAQSVSGSNSLTETSHKSAQEDPFVTLFKKTAAEVVPHLPLMSEEHKVAHVRALMGLNNHERAQYLVTVQKEAASKTAADHTPAQVPPGSRTDGYAKHDPEATHSRPGAYDGRTGNQGTKQAEDGHLPPWMQPKKDEKKDGEKSEAKPEDKKPEEKKDEKHEEKKEASLEECLRQIVAQSQTPAK